MTHPNLTLLRTTPKAPTTLRWTGTALDLLDQTHLPQEIIYRRCEDGEAVREAIVKLQVRGAPAIGLAAAWGLALAMNGHDHLEPGAWRRALKTAAAPASKRSANGRESRLGARPAVVGSHRRSEAEWSLRARASSHGDGGPAPG